jgi:hypothetical protein
MERKGSRGIREMRDGLKLKVEKLVIIRHGFVSHLHW